MGAPSSAMGGGNLSGNSVVVTPAISTTYTCIGIDSNGCMNTKQVALIVSDCVGIKDGFSGQILFDVFPNPSTGDFTIKNDHLKECELRIFNPIGQKVFDLELQELTTLVKTKLNPGLYLIKILKGETLVSINKLIIE